MSKKQREASGIDIPNKLAGPRPQPRPSGVPVGLGLMGAFNMSEKEKAAKTRDQFLRDAFEGMKGRQPGSDNELNQWLSTDEGKMATLFDDTTLSPLGERGRS
jgi:hypothetical protein